MDSLALLIAGAAGCILGAIIGVVASGFITARRNRRLVIETWSAAGRYHELKSRQP